MVEVGNAQADPGMAALIADHFLSESGNVFPCGCSDSVFHEYLALASLSQHWLKAGGAGENGNFYSIGISQFAVHGSLDNCREGFLAGMEFASLVV